MPPVSPWQGTEAESLLRSARHDVPVWSVRLVCGGQLTTGFSLLCYVNLRNASRPGGQAEISLGSDEDRRAAGTL